MRADGQSLQAQLAGWAATVDADAIPARVLTKAQELLLDTLGVALAGSAHPAGRRISTVVRALGGESQASVLGARQRTSAIHAALANAFFAHVLDFDDTHLDVYLHVNAPVFGAALALGEHREKSGRDFVTAYVVGLEVTSRIGLCVRNQLAYAWHWDGIVGAFGATAAAGRLLSLSADEMSRAFGIASQLASGIRAHKGTMTKALSPANAASNGVLAAIAARNEITSSDNAFEHAEGFFRAHGESDVSQLTIGLGQSYRLMDSEPKPYPCGVIMHPAIDAALELHSRGIRQADLTTVHLYVNADAITVTGERHPPDGLRSKFSVFHGVAIALAVGSVEVAHFEDDCVTSEPIKTLRSMIVCQAKQDISRDEATLVVETTDGRTLRASVKARGTRDRRMSMPEIERKFMTLANPVLGIDQAARIVRAAGEAVHLRAISELVRLCIPAIATARRASRPE